MLVRKTLCWKHVSHRHSLLGRELNNVVSARATAISTGGGSASASASASGTGKSDSPTSAEVSPLIA